MKQKKPTMRQYTKSQVVDKILDIKKNQTKKLNDLKIKYPI